MQQVTKKGTKISGDTAVSRELPSIGCYVKDEFAQEFQVQSSVHVPRAKAGKGPRFGQLILVMGLIAGAGLWFGFHRNAASDFKPWQSIKELTHQVFLNVKFPVEQVHIVGHKYTKEQAIINQLGPIWDQSLLALNSGEVQSEIEKLPWVKKAIVERAFPNGLNIFVTERVPIGRWLTLNNRYVFDKDGVVIEKIDVGAHINLPIFEGGGAPLEGAQLLETLNKFDDLRPFFVRFRRKDQRRWSLILKDGMQILLPEKQMARGLSRLRALQIQHNILAKDLVVIDLRLDDRVTLRPKKGGKLKVLSTLEDLGAKSKLKIDSQSIHSDGI